MRVISSSGVSSSKIATRSTASSAASTSARALSFCTGRPSPFSRFTEASLVKELEEDGIGRPSTYASILGTIINDRGYVHRERRTLTPTELGMAVTDKLIPYFQDIMNVEFTAQMEDNLDKIEEGQRKWVDTVREFYEPFKRDLARAKREMQSEKVGAPTSPATDEQLTMAPPPDASIAGIW